MNTLTPFLSSAVSDEVMNIANAIKKERPQVDMSGVQHMLEWYRRVYADDIECKDNLVTCLQTNNGYRLEYRERDSSLRKILCFSVPTRKRLIEQKNSCVCKHVAMITRKQKNQIRELILHPNIR